MFEPSQPGKRYKSTPLVWLAHSVLGRIIAGFLAVVLAVTGLTTASVALTPQQALAALPQTTTSSADGRITVTKTPSVTTLPSYGGDVTYTYTVRNNLPSKTDYWGYEQNYLTYFSFIDDKCGNMEHKSGLTSDRYGSYLFPGKTATFTCTMPITQTTTNEATADFFDRLGAHSTATASATVSVQEGEYSCNTLSFTTASSAGTGKWGTMSAGQAPVSTANMPDITDYSGNVYDNSSASAISSSEPQYIYYSAQYNYIDASNVGLYKLDMKTNETTRVTGASAATNTNRLAFGPDGTLWSFATNGHVYSLAKGATSWSDKGTPVASDGRSFSSLTLGDLAFDGLGNMWVLGDGGSGGVLYTISNSELTGGGTVNAQLVGRVSIQSGFFGLSFGPDGTLYASQDKGSSGSIWTINKVNGMGTEIVSASSQLAGVQDLGSCAMPKPELRSTKSNTPDSKTPVAAGDVITYTITMENIGNLEATGVTFKDVIPANTTYVAGSTNLNGTALADTNGTFPYIDTREVHSAGAFDGVIAPGGKATVTFKVKVNSPIPDGVKKISNQGTVNYVGGDPDHPTDDPKVPGGEDPTENPVLIPAIGIDKTADKTVVDMADKKVTYSYAVTTNMLDAAGNVTKVGTEPVKNVKVTDDKCSPATPIETDGKNAGDTNADGILQPGEIWRYTCSTELSSTTTNTAIATGNGERSNTPVQDDDTWTVTFLTASINATKTAGTTTGADANGNATVTYTVTVKNDGLGTGTYSAIKDIVGFDKNLKPTSVTVDGQPVTLNPGMTFTVTNGGTLAGGALKTFQIAVNYTFISKTVPVTTCGTAPAAGKGLFNAIEMNGDTITTDNTACVDPLPIKAITVNKSHNGYTDVNGNGLLDTGDKITYLFTVTNGGNIALTNVNVTDVFTAPGGQGATSAVTCDATTLAPGAATSCRMTYTVAATDMGLAKVDNQATSHGTTPDGGTIDSAPAPDTFTPQAPKPGIALVKAVRDASGDSTYSVGETLTYTFAVTNTGNTVLTGVTINEKSFTGSAKMSAVTCADTVLTPGAVTTCTATYTATQADVDAKKIDNVATATGTPGTTGTPITSNDAPATIPADYSAAITLVKKAGTPVDVNKDGLVNKGDTIVFTFLVTNTGTTTLNAVTVNDPMLAAAGLNVTCPVATLAPKASVTCTSTAYTITDADVAAGKVHNVATATGTTPGGETPKSPESPTDTPTTKSAPKLTLVKDVADASKNGQVEAGEVLTYTFTVTNTGNVAINNLSITDTFTKGGTGTLSAITCVKTSIAPNETTTCTATYTATQADIDAGGVDNKATAGGTSQTDGGKVTSNEDPATIGTDLVTKLVLDKKVKTITDVNNDGLQDAGDSVVYEFAVTNESSVTLHDIAINDPKLAGLTIVCAKTTLAPRESTVCTADPYTITVAEQKAGSVDNTATANGKTPTNTDVPSNKDSETIPLVTPAPGIALTKSVADASADKIATLGEVLTYSFLVKNTGNVQLANVTINEKAFSGAEKISAISCPKTMLAVGEEMTCTAIYTVTQADIDAGKITNAATVTGTTPGGNKPETPPSTTTIDTPKTAKLTLDKQVSSTTFTAGDTLTYTFIVTNIGDVTIKNVSIADTFTAGGTGTLSPITCDKTELAPKAVATCTATYVTNQTDVDAGTVKNTATATGTDPQGGNVPSNPDDATATPNQQPKLILDKEIAKITDVNADGLNNAGDTITWTFKVNNAGNTTLNNVKIIDTFLGNAGIAITCPKATLAVGEEMICTSAGYTITDVDVKNGTVHNTATAHGNTPDKPGTDVPSTPDETNTPTTPSDPKIETTKAAQLNDKDGDAKGDLGETITFSFTIKNTGNVPVSTLTIDDAKLGLVGMPVSADTCTLNPAGFSGTLAPNASVTCTLKTAYAITQTDVDAGNVHNVATGKGTTPGGGTPEDPSNPTDTPTDRATGIELDKISDVSSVAKVGDAITYTFSVKNTGTVTLANVVISDAKLNLSKVACVAELKPGQSLTCAVSAKYLVTQSDIDAGTILNTATTTGTPPAGMTPPTDTDDTIVKATPNAGIRLVKSAKLNDLNANARGDLGETITFSFVVTNSGNVTLHNVTVDDPMLAKSGVTVTCPAGDLVPGASTTCSAAPDYVITQADVDAGHVKNVATAQGTTPGGQTPKTPESPTDTPTDVTPGVALVKTAQLKDLDGDGLADKGEKIVFRFTLTNTGKVTLTDLTVNDPMLVAAGVPITCTPTTIKPGEKSTCISAEYTVTQADVDAGRIYNVATANGTTPDGSQTPSNPADSTTPVDDTPKLALDKKVQGEPAVVKAGDQMVFTFTVTNTGNVTLKSMTIDDPMLKALNLAVTCDVVTLAPGATAVCTSAPYTVTQTDVDAGHVANKAIAHATTPGTPGTDVPSNPDTTTTPTPNTSGMTLLKKAALNDLDGDKLADKGETITFSFAITNTGDVSLSNVTVADAKLGLPAMAVNADTCTLSPADFNGALAPKATVVCTLKTAYTVTQADVEAGTVHNVATAQGTTPGGQTPKTPESPTDTPTDSSPSIAIVKSAKLNDVDAANHTGGKADIGETISYSFVVTNTGKVALAHVHVVDRMANGANLVITCPSDRLEPGASMTCTAAPYAVTQADVDRGRIDNSAIAKGTPGKPTDPNNPEIPSPPSETTTPTSQTPGISMVKKPSVTHIVNVGDVIDYTFTVTNIGTVTLTNITVSDATLARQGITVTCNATTLAPGVSTECYGRGYKATVADMNAGAVTNTAMATGTPPPGLTPPTDDDAAVVTVTPKSDLDIVKSAKLNDANANAKGDLGETITFSFVVTNNGNQSVSNIVVDDPMLAQAGNAITCLSSTLDPGASTTCTVAPDYVITQADVDAGKVHNVATVKGATPGGETPKVPSNPTDTPTTQNPTLALVKKAALGDVNGNMLADVNEQIVYSFVVTNTGNVTLHNITVSDPMLATVSVAITCPTTTLAPGATTTCTSAPYTVTQADVNRGAIHNAATATGTTPGGETPKTPESPADVPANKAPLLALKKVATLNDTNGDKVGQLGETITYSFVVTNVGTTDMAGITIQDPKLSGLQIHAICPPTTLHPGDSLTCIADKPYTITQTDVDMGHADNIATASGHVPPKPGDTTLVEEEPPTPPSETTTPTDSTKKLVLDKIATLNDLNGNKLADRGETISYGFIVTNTGAQTLTDVTINDTMGNGAKLEISCPETTLAPGASTTCTAKPYMVTQTDVDAGSIKNSATATGKGSDGTPVGSNEDHETVPANPTAQLALVKAAELHDANGNGKGDLGETITYSFMLTNTGAVTLNNIKVDDRMLEINGITITCPVVSLAGGDAIRCVAGADYAITQADVEAGQVYNVAIATGTVPRPNAPGNDGDLPKVPSNPSDTTTTVTPPVIPPPPSRMAETGAAVPAAGLALALLSLVVGVGAVVKGARNYPSDRNNQ